jgi:hypothetical protein
MVSHIFDFLIQGHEKVIGHYKLLLSSNGLSRYERELIQERLKKEEAVYRRLIETGDAV